MPTTENVTQRYAVTNTGSCLKVVDRFAPTAHVKNFRTAQRAAARDYVDGLNREETNRWRAVERMGLRPAFVNGDWRAEDAAPFAALVVDSMRWSGGVVPAVDRDALRGLIHEQAEMQRGTHGADQYGLRLDGEVLIVTAPLSGDVEAEAGVDLQRVEPVVIDGVQRWLLDLGWTFFEQERVTDVEGCCAEYEQCSPRGPEEAIGEWIDGLVQHLAENGYAKADQTAVREAMRKRHGWVDTSDLTPSSVPLVIKVDDDADEVCPVCGSDDLQMWADDGESPRADYYACEACKATGDVVQPEGWSNADLHANAEPFPEGPLCRFLNLHVEGVQRRMTNVEEDQPDAVCSQAERQVLDAAFALKRENPDALVTLVVDWELAG